MKTSRPTLVLALAVIALSGAVRAQNIQLADNLVRCANADCSGEPMPLNQLNTAQALGTQSFNHWFWLQRLFWHSTDPSEIDPQAKAYYSQLIAETQTRGMDVIGKVGTWIFPPYAFAPRTPMGRECVPSNPQEYNRLMQWRTGMLRTLAREFPEIDKWIVGNEPENAFLYCDGTRMPSSEYVPIVVDMLEQTYPAMKSENPNAIIIYHALGGVGVSQILPNSLEPDDTLRAVYDEIASRGLNPDNLFDGIGINAYPAIHTKIATYQNYVVPYKAVTAVPAAKGDPGKPFYQSEGGYAKYAWLGGSDAKAGTYLETVMGLLKVHFPEFQTISKFTLCEFTSNGWGMYKCPQMIGDTRPAYFADFIDSSPIRIHITPSKPFGRIYWNDAYGIKVDGISNDWVDVRFILPDGSILDATHLWFVDANGFAVQATSSSTTPGTYKVTHIRRSGTGFWQPVPEVEMEVVNSSVPSYLKAMNCGPRITRIGDGYVVHFTNAANKSVDLKVSVNGGPVQTYYGVWNLNQYGIAYQPIGPGTPMSTTKFVQFRLSGQSTFTNVTDLENQEVEISILSQN